jgi:hypothetical protein
MGDIIHESRLLQTLMTDTKTFILDRARQKALGPLMLLVQT